MYSAVIIQKCELKPTDHILEIGCGWGGFAVRAVKASGCKLTGITIRCGTCFVNVLYYPFQTGNGCVRIILQAEMTRCWVRQGVGDAHCLKSTFVDGILLYLLP